MALNIRADTAPIPECCPRCGGDTLLRPPPLTLAQRLRLIAVDGDVEAPL